MLRVCFVFAPTDRDHLAAGLVEQQMAQSSPPVTTLQRVPPHSAKFSLAVELSEAQFLDSARGHYFQGGFALVHLPEISIPRASGWLDSLH